MRIFFLFCLLALAPNLWSAKPITPLTPEQAFRLTVPEATSDHIRVEFLIAPGTYLYQKEFKFVADKAKLGEPEFPAGKTHQDPYFGEVTIFEHSALITIPIIAIQAQDLQLKASYQGCNEMGFCYPPQESHLNITVEAATFMPSANETDTVLHILQNTSLGWALLAFFGFGLLLAFTPCVLPMIPILVSLIIGEQHKNHRWHAFRLALIYVLAMATTYAVLGALVASLGAHIQAQLQHPITLSITAAILIGMAILLFNDKALAFASRISQPLHALSSKMRAGKAWGVAAMGVISTLIISPCVTPPLIGALTYISLTGNVILGGSALFVLALGMGVPLLIVAWGGTALLPKRGPWLNYVKHIFAVILIVMALSLLARFMIPAFEARKSSLPFTAIPTIQILDQSLAQAKGQHQPVMLDYYADWCTTCVSMEHTVFNDPAVKRKLSEVSLLKVDVTDYNDATAALMAAHHVYGPPALIFFDANGQEMTSLRVDGSTSAAELIKRLDVLLHKTQ